MPTSILVIEPEGSSIGQLPLLERGTRLETFRSPEEGFAACLATSPSAILISAQQRRGDGLQLCRNIRDQVGGDVPIIVFGRPSRAQRRQINRNQGKIKDQYGYDHFLQRKPTASDLDILLRTYLAQRERTTAGEASRITRRRTFSARRDDIEIAASYSWGELMRNDISLHSLRLLWLKFKLMLQRPSAV
ncbi:MAG: hypothetical protein AAFV53_41465 [Myxococcota bacterium]